MKVKEPVNRVAVEMKMWDDREARFKEIFKNYPKATQSRAFQVEKLEFYEEVSRKFRNSPDKDERLAAKFIAEQATDLERNLYQSRTVRFLRGAFNAVDNLFKSAEKVLNVPTLPPPVPKMSPALNKTLVRAGFGAIVKQVEERIKNGDQEILTNTSQFHKHGEKTDYVVGVKMDGLGNYHFLGFKASIPDKDKPGEMLSQRYYYQQDNQITAKRAYNELEGRAVSVDYTQGKEKRHSMVALDFNDKDAAGNFRKKEFPMESFDWKKEISVLPLKDMGQPLLTRLEKGILEGNREKVTFVKDGNDQTFYIEANPQHKSLLITDEKQNKFTLNEAVYHTTHKGERLGTELGSKYLQKEFDTMPLLYQTKVQIDNIINNLLRGAPGQISMNVDGKERKYNLAFDEKEGLTIKDKTKKIVTKEEMWKLWTSDAKLPKLDNIKQVEMTFSKTNGKQSIKEEQPKINLEKSAKKRGRGVV